MLNVYIDPQIFDWANVTNLFLVFRNCKLYLPPIEAGPELVGLPSSALYYKMVRNRNLSPPFPTHA